jgi:hypothetical protein
MSSQPEHGQVPATLLLFSLVQACCTKRIKLPTGYATEKV